MASHNSEFEGGQHIPDRSIPALAVNLDETLGGGEVLSAPVLILRADDEALLEEVVRDQARHTDRGRVVIAAVDDFAPNVTHADRVGDGTDRQRRIGAIDVVAENYQNLAFDRGPDQLPA